MTITVYEFPLIKLAKKLKDTPTGRLLFFSLVSIN